MKSLTNQYDDVGFCCFRVDQNEKIATALAEIDKIIEKPDGIQVKWRHATGKVKHLVNCHHRSEALKALIQSPQIKEFCKQKFGNTPLFVTHSKVSFKFKDIDQTWLPHQDSSYKFFLSKPQGCAFAFHLEDIDKENGALEIFPKSHKKGRLKHNVKFVSGESEPQTEVIEMPLLPPLSIEGKAGTVCAFNLNTLHQSGINKKGGSRPIFIFEVQTVNLFPFEYNGQDAIMINEEYFRPKAKFLYPFIRKSLFLSDAFVRPFLKKIIFKVYNFTNKK